MRATDTDPYDRLEHLDAMAAIKAWLLGDYKPGEERVLILAIRRETGLELTDAEIRSTLIEASAVCLPAMSAFRKLMEMETDWGEEPAAIKPR